METMNIEQWEDKAGQNTNYFISYFYSFVTKYKHALYQYVMNAFMLKIMLNFVILQ